MKPIRLALLTCALGATAVAFAENPFNALKSPVAPAPDTLEPSRFSPAPDSAE